ncbi:MAG: hypothetical protein R8K20_04075, partial [Gallionellaceae bacterium]
DKAAATKRYRETANCDSKVAKQAVSDIEMELRETHPTSFRESKKNTVIIIAVVSVFLIVTIFVSGKVAMKYKDQWEVMLGNVMRDAVKKIKHNVGTLYAEESKAIPSAKNETTNSKGLQKNQDQLSQAEKQQAAKNKASKDNEPSQIVDHDTPYQAIKPKENEDDLSALYRKKLANPQYLAWKSQPGLPKGYQDNIEERHIKYALAKISKNIKLPGKTKVQSIPLISTSSITIDGIIETNEWKRASKVKLDPNEFGSTLYLQADKDWLYLAADVPGDTTQSGWDQFRFYIHVDIDPAIVNERIHVRGSKQTPLGGIRQTRILWQGEPAKNQNERWKKSPISDWRIYRLAIGASSVQKHRQYEAKLNLKEIGLSTGVAFPAFVKIETDPKMKGGHRKRQYLGALGNQENPVWMIMK